MQRVLLAICCFTFHFQCQECWACNASLISEENHWGVSRAEAEEGISQMISDNITCAGLDCVLLKFLYVKGIYPSFDFIVRKRHFELVLNPEKSHTPELAKQYKEVKERLVAIAAPSGDVTANEIPEDVQTFDQAMNILQDWNQGNGSDEIHIFHLHHKEVQGRDVLVQRVQRSSLCYLYAPAVLSHYLVSRNGLSDSFQMIDIAQHVAGSFSSEALKAHLFDNRGHNSFHILISFLTPRSEFEYYKIEEIDIRTFESYGPALVSNFAVFDDFMADDDKIHYEGLPRGKFLGYHSMVLLGMKTKPKRTFMLQNWWSKKQFISISEEYLKATRARIFFVTTPEMSMPASFSTNSFRYAETLVLDRPERLPEERLSPRRLRADGL